MVVKKIKIFRAFSIIELSISLLIIAVIMSVVAGSIKMVSSTRLTNARSLTSRSPVPKISGLVAWYETSLTQSLKASETINDAQVSSWYDISPGSLSKQRNTLTKTASDSATYQIEGIGNVPSIYFDGSANGFSLSSFYQGVSKQNTIFIVAKPSALSSSTASMAITSNCSSSLTSTSFLPSGIELHLQNVVTASTKIETNVDYILAAYYNGSSSKVYLNDAANMLGGLTLDVGAINLTNSLTGLSVGGCSPWLFRGWLSEVIIYNRPLQTQERKDVMNYLAQKYNVTVNGI